MRDYVILTDSGSDLPPDFAKKIGVDVIPLMLFLDGVPHPDYLGKEGMTCKDFYGELREKKQGTTSAINIDEFRQVMETYVKEGKDVLYLSLSSGLSATYHHSTLAVEELVQSYPDAKIFSVDSLGASLGQGMMAFLAAEEKRKGKTIEEVRDYLEDIKLKLAHWFTVDDLNHLKRGGRISAAAALLGSTLNIKPILHVDEEGHLIPVSKVRGRRNAIKKLAEKLVEQGVNLEEQTIFISHGDCLEEAETLARLVREQVTVKDVIIDYVGPVIGAHTGPGVIAIFFLGSGR